MSQIKNRKLCLNCDGSVHIHSTKCPYCGTDLTAEAVASAPVQQQQAYTPPPPAYSTTNSSAQIPQPPYGNMPSASQSPFASTPIKEAVRTEEVESHQQAAFLPLLLMIPGAFFLLFAFMLLFFSDNGVLTLRWNAGYWFVYLLLGAPLLFFGWRILSGMSSNTRVSSSESSIDKLFDSK